MEDLRNDQNPFTFTSSIYRLSYLFTSAVDVGEGTEMRIILPMSPRVNAMYKTTRNGGFYKTQEAKDWIKEAGYKLLGMKPTEDAVRLKVDFYFKRDRDIDSSLKGLLDLLQGRIYINDSQIEELNIRKFKDSENPRVEVERLED